MKIIKDMQIEQELNDKQMDMMDRILIAMSKENIDAKNDFLLHDITNDNQLDIKIYAQYDSAIMANTILNALTLLDIKFCFNYEMNSLAIDRTNKYIITSEALDRIGAEIEKCFNTQMDLIRAFRETHDRTCLKYELKILECIDTFFGYSRILYSMGFFMDPNDKILKMLEPGDEMMSSAVLGNLDSNRTQTRDYIVKRLKNYNAYLKALVKREEAIDELKYQSKRTLNVDRYQAVVDECDKALDEIRDEYEEIDRLDREFAMTIIQKLHSKQMSDMCENAESSQA